MSHYVSHFAAFVIGARTKISIVTSRITFSVEKAFDCKSVKVYVKDALASVERTTRD